MTNQLIRFVLVGSLATALHTIVAWLCETLVPSLHLNVSNVIGFLCAFPVSYWGQRSFTFGHDGKHRPALIRFGASQLFGLIINSAVVFLMVRLFEREHPIFVLVGIGCAVVAVFVLSKFWAFVPEQRSG